MKMIVVDQYTLVMFFFHIIEVVIMYENDCYYHTKDTKQFFTYFNKPLC